VKSIVLGVIVVSSVLAGCASHHELAAPRADLARSGLINDPAEVSRLEKAMTNGEIASLLDLDVKAKLPTTLAVARLESLCAGYQPRLQRIDGEELGRWQDIASRQPHVDGVQPISSLAFGNSLSEPQLTLRSLRVAAARMHCELLLVYMRGDSSVENYNDAAVLYWTLVGLWVVPGHTLEHKTVMQAVLVDCRTGMILGTATGSGYEKRNCTAAAIDIHRAKLASAVPVAALGDLHDGVKHLLGDVVNRAVAGKMNAGRQPAQERIADERNVE